jgi:hypothetical protein
LKEYSFEMGVIGNKSKEAIYDYKEC